MVSVERKSCWITTLLHRIAANTISFQLRSQGKKKALAGSVNPRTVPDVSPMEIKATKLGRHSLLGRIGDHGVESEAREKTPHGFPLVSLTGWSPEREADLWIAGLIALLLMWCADKMNHLQDDKCFYYSLSAV